MMVLLLRIIRRKLGGRLIRYIKRMEILGGLLFVFYLLKIVFHYNLLFDKKVLIQNNANKSNLIDSIISSSRRQTYLWIFYSSIMLPVFSKYPQNKKAFRVLSNIAVAGFYFTFLVMIIIGINLSS